MTNKLADAHDRLISCAVMFATTKKLHDEVADPAAKEILLRHGRQYSDWMHNAALAYLEAATTSV